MPLYSSVKSLSPAWKAWFPAHQDAIRDQRYITTITRLVKFHHDFNQNHNICLIQNQVIGFQLLTIQFQWMVRRLTL